MENILNAERELIKKQIGITDLFSRSTGLKRYKEVIRQKRSVANNETKRGVI
jgi:hypothetical protein